MPKHTEIEEVQKWHNRIATSERFRKRESEKYRWEEAIDQYKGDFSRLQNQFDIPIPLIQLVFSYIKTEIPRLYLRDPHIKVNPKKESSIQSAKILEMALNYIWRRKRFKNEIKKCIIDGKLIGHAWFKTGYTGKFGTIEDSLGTIMEFIESEDFFGYRLPWRHVYFDVDAIDPPHDCRWIAHEFWLPLDDVKKDKSFNQSVVDKITGSPKNKANMEFRAGKETQSDVVMGRFFEIWDIENEEKLVIAEGVDKYVKEKIKWPYKLKGYPFSFLKFHTVNDEPYGLSDVYMLQDQFMERIKLRAAQIDHLKRFNRQYLTEPNNLDEENKSLLGLGVTGSVIEANKGPQSVIPIPYPPLPQDAYAVEDRIANDQIVVSGQNPVESGAPSKAPTRTIREVIEQQQGSENRRSEQIDVIEDFVEDISQHIIALLQQYATTPFYVAVTGEDPLSIMQELDGRPSQVDDPTTAITTREGFTFTKKDIQGEFDVEIVAGSTVPLNKATVLDILTQITPLAQQLGAQPGGPIAGAIGRLFGELLDMPELKIALEKEFRLQQQIQAQNNEAAEQRIQMIAARDAANTEMQSQRIAVQSQKTILDAALRAAELEKARTEGER